MTHIDSNGSYNNEQQQKFQLWDIRERILFPSIFGGREKLIFEKVNIV